MYYKRAGGCERVETSAKTDKRAEPVCCLQGVSLTSSFQAPLSASQEACCQAIDASRPQPFCYPSPRARFCLARYAVIICDHPVLWDGRTPPGLEKSCETPSSRASWARFFFHGAERAACGYASISTSDCNLGAMRRRRGLQKNERRRESSGLSCAF